MINRAICIAGAVVLAVLLGTLAVQSVRLAKATVDLSSTARELAAANDLVVRLRASETALTVARDALAGQVTACQQANARDRARTASRAVIVKQAKAVPAKPGSVIDAATSRRAAVHLNAACRR